MDGCGSLFTSVPQVCSYCSKKILCGLTDRGRRKQLPILYFPMIYIIYIVFAYYKKSIYNKINKRRNAIEYQIEEESENGKIV